MPRWLPDATASLVAVLQRPWEQGEERSRPSSLARPCVRTSGMGIPPPSISRLSTSADEEWDTVKSASNRARRVGARRAHGGTPVTVAMAILASNAVRQLRDDRFAIQWSSNRVSWGRARFHRAAAGSHHTRLA